MSNLESFTVQFGDHLFSNLASFTVQFGIILCPIWGSFVVQFRVQVGDHLLFNLESKLGIICFPIWDHLLSNLGIIYGPIWGSTVELYKTIARRSFQGVLHRAISRTMYKIFYINAWHPRQAKMSCGKQLIAVTLCTLWREKAIAYKLKNSLDFPDFLFPKSSKT